MKTNPKKLSNLSFAEIRVKKNNNTWLEIEETWKEYKRSLNWYKFNEKKIDE